VPPCSQLVLPSGRRRARRLLRLIRAMWYDTSALLREFRRPLLILFTALFGGGLLYQQLMIAYGYPDESIPPYINMPYVMLALMVLESPVDLPTEPPLMAFWYALPLVAIYVVGRGASDFVRLFFIRNERRDAWEEAVASTYRNHVIVLGVGHVGLRVIRILTAMGFDVVSIDKENTPEVDAELRRRGVPCILGDGRLPTVLEKAGLRYAQAFIVCTSSDYVHLEAIMHARDMNPDIRIVARMWDDQFSNQLRRFMGVQVVLSASELAAPAFAGMAVGIEVAQTLRIHNQEFSMIRLTVQSGSFLDGETIHDLQTHYDLDIVLHGRGDQVEVHPADAIRVQSGDTLVVFARHDRIVDVVARNRPGKNGA